ncbi:hypothetical protein AB6A23_09365 [Paenibacillus tarimensis]
MANHEVKVICKEDCGNAPKKILIRDFVTALGRIDQESIRAFLADDIQADIVGMRQIQGIDEFMEFARLSQEARITEIKIDTILTHGYGGSVSGVMKTENNSFAFGEFYRFNSVKNAKIKEITSYRITLC